MESKSAQSNLIHFGEVTVKKKGKIKAPTKTERAEKLRDRILGLPDELVQEGYGDLLKPPGPIKLIAAPMSDAHTHGTIGHVEEPLAVYIQRVSVADNFSQRPPFDHVRDPIYCRLIDHFIDGATMPESKVAALSKASSDKRATSLERPDLQFSIIDGLQRLYCYCIALLLVLHRDALVKEGCIPADVWEDFKDIVEKKGDKQTATRELLTRTTRYEVFYNIDLQGLLHYMVTYNTGQRRMSLAVQLEIMRKPLIQELSEKALIPIHQAISILPGQAKPKDKFAAADLTLATQAFITNNAQVTASTEAERVLDTSEGFLEDVGDIEDVVKTLKRIGTELHPKVMEVYAADSSRRYILSAGGTFLLGLTAACGYIRNRNNMKMLDGALDKLLKLASSGSEDPLNLEGYASAVQAITASRGKSIRRLVFDTFLRYLNGTTTKLEWTDTASQITGNVAFAP